jgi:hypothetical protein
MHVIETNLCGGVENREMNDNELLAKLVRLQEEQNELLKKHLFRMRFSVATLLLLMTLVCITLGILFFVSEPPAPSRPSAPLAVPTTPPTAAQPFDQRGQPTDDLFGPPSPTPSTSDDPFGESK